MISAVGKYRPEIRVMTRNCGVFSFQCCQAPTQLQTQTPELELGPIFGFHHPPHHITFLNHKIQLKLATIGRDNMNKEAG